MKTCLQIAFFLLSSFLATAQKQANIWYFGTRVGLDFNHTPPQRLINGNLTSPEAMAAISDNNGRLLFYSNGVTIMNRQHLVMKNGGGLGGHTSSTNNVLIVPLPGNDSVYYVFTVGAANEAIQQFQYNIVDMKGDGGLGELDGITANSIVEDEIFEKLAAVRHCNNKDVWIVIRKWNSDEYHAYLLTASGLSNTPVISNTGLIINGNELNALGTLKFSPGGKKLVAAHSFDNDAIELMDFNNTTGVLTNPLVIYPNNTRVAMGAYGAEFSADGKLLYVSSTDYSSETSAVYQFDITSNNAATITASKQVIHQNTIYNAGALQIGPDQKIYMAMFGDSAISVIEDPGVYGTGCNFNYNKIYMGPAAGQPVLLGLTTFMSSLFDTTSNPYDFARVPGNCLDLNVSFKINRLSGIDSVKWDFGDGQQSQLLQPSNTYLAPGFYDVNLIVYKIDCSGLNDTITRRIWIANSDKFLGADTSSCKAFNMDIGIDEIFGVNYLWSNGSVSNRTTIYGFGDYWLELDQNGCKLRDTISVVSKPKPVVNLGVDTTICRYKPVVLTTGSQVFNSYTWSTGETTPTIFINQTGTYHVTVTEGECDASDTIRVLPGDCDIFIPSAFTPNNDKLNETFGASDNSAVLGFSLQIFNKWGELIFNAKDITQKWDGTFKGKPMPNGAYFWMMNYTNKRGIKVYEQGMVMLIR